MPSKNEYNLFECLGKKGIDIFANSFQNPGLLNWWDTRELDSALALAQAATQKDP